MKTTVLAAMIFAVPATACAQFNDMMRTMQTIVPPIVNKSKEPAEAPAIKAKPAAAKPAAPAPVAAQKREVAPAASVVAEQPGYVDDRICTRDSIAFSCKINDKPLIFCKTFETEEPYLSVTLNHSYDTGKNELSHSSDQNGPFFLSQEDDNRRSVTTVYFTQKNMTYGISECDGMLCNPEERYWFTTFKGTEKVSQAVCDPGTETGFAFPVNFDKKGKLVAQMKNVLAIKPSKLKFEQN